MSEETRKDRAVCSPYVDIVEKDGEVLILADMPGVDEKSVEITLERNQLQVYGEVKEHHGNCGNCDYRSTFTLTDKVDRDGIKAKVKNGVVSIVVAKAKEAKPRKIRVTHN